jgi:hypothetical protein
VQRRRLRVGRCYADVFCCRHVLHHDQTGPGGSRLADVSKKVAPEGRGQLQECRRLRPGSQDFQNSNPWLLWWCEDGGGGYPTKAKVAWGTGRRGWGPCRAASSCCCSWVSSSSLDILRTSSSGGPCRCCLPLFHLLHHTFPQHTTPHLYIPLTPACHNTQHT